MRIAYPDAAICAAPTVERTITMEMTLESLFTRFLEWARLALAPNTVAAYAHQLGKLTRKAAAAKVSDITPANVTIWARTWHEAQALVRALNWAVHEARILPAHPLGRIRMPRRNQRNRILSPHEIAGLIRAARRPGRQFLLALRETYARPQEIRAACFEDLCSEDVNLTIDDALAQGRALIVLRTFKDCERRRDSTRPRVLLISARLGRLILRIKARRRDLNGPIFRNALGRPWTKNAVRCLVRRLRAKHGLLADGRGEKVCAYTFRHSLATWAAANGITDRTLADLLGHVETRTTSRYLHLRTSHLREALRRARENGRRQTTD